MPDIQMAPYVLGAYVGVWTVLLVYVANLAMQVAKVKKELDHLQDTVKNT